MLKVLTLSTNEIVTFKPAYTHGADLAFSEVRYGQVYEKETVPDGKGGTRERDRVPVAVAIKAVDAALPMVIEKIEKDGQSQPPSLEWLKDLPLPDYEVLYKTILELRDETDAKVEAGKKNG